MSSRLKKLVLLLAIAVMPLQGIAGALSVLICHGEAQSHATHAQDDHDHGASPQGGHHDDAGTGGDLGYHLCCHHTASGVPVVFLPAATSALPAPATALLLLHDLFLPDRPQRPPLA